MLFLFPTSCWPPRVLTELIRVLPQTSILFPYTKGPYFSGSWLRSYGRGCITPWGVHLWHFWIGMGKRQAHYTGQRGALFKPRSCTCSMFLTQLQFYYPYARWVAPYAHWNVPTDHCNLNSVLVFTSQAFYYSTGSTLHILLDPSKMLPRHSFYTR